MRLPRYSKSPGAACTSTYEDGPGATGTYLLASVLCLRRTCEPAPVAWQWRQQDHRGPSAGRPLSLTYSTSRDTAAGL